MNVASEIIKCMTKRNININGSNILILGITFKENCPDTRNSKVVDLVSSLKSYGPKITIYDPWADEKEVMDTFNLKSEKSVPKDSFDAIILAVPHKKFKKLNFLSLKNKNSIIYDIKNFLPVELVDGKL